MRYDALIVGGGPAGSATAILLAEAGWSVAVVEKSRFPRRKVCGEYLSAGNGPLLDRLGVGDAFRAAAGPEVRRVAVFAGDAAISACMPAGRAGAPVWGRALGRSALDALLLDRAAGAGASLFQPWKAVAIARGSDGFTCRIAPMIGGVEETIKAPVVVAAHGSWERGALPSQPQRAHSTADLLGFKAHFSGSRLPRDLMPLLAFPGGYGGMVRTDRDRVSLSLCIRRDVLDLCREREPGEPAASALFRHVLASCAGVRQALAGAGLEERWLAAGPIAPGIRTSPQTGLFLVGNAAGEAHPIVAEGIGMAMQSAWLLSRRLIDLGHGVHPEARLAEVGTAYARDWRASFGTRIRAAAFYSALAMRPGAVAGLIPVLTRYPGLLTWGAELSGKAKPVRFPTSWASPANGG